MKKKILFVAMQMSIHTARWINQISCDEYEIHIFPINSMALHPSLVDKVIVHQPFHSFGLRTYLKSFLNYRNTCERYIYHIPVPNCITSYLSMVQKYFGNTDASVPLLYSAFFLKKLIKKLKPDLIHSLEFQHCSYNVLEAKKHFSDCFPKWLATNWGSDIYYYKNDKYHLEIIKELLQLVDYYSCECKRDVKLALSLGCKAKIQPVIPNTGGFNLQEVNMIRNITQTSRRKIILIKGYQHFAGRALTALNAIEANVDLLDGYKIIVYSATPDVLERINYLKQIYQLNIESLGYVEHDLMLRYFGKARIYLGISISDAISTSLLEAMAMGAFPIQTNTSCCDEWIKDGETGYSVSFNNLSEIISALKNALTNDALVDAASIENWKTVQERLDGDKMCIKVSEFYRNIFET